MRIHVSETDKFRGKLAYQEIITLLRERHLAGATVLRGSMSFGLHSEIHTDRIEVRSYDMPIAIECVETEENIRLLFRIPAVFLRRTPVAARPPRRVRVPAPTLRAQSSLRRRACRSM